MRVLTYNVHGWETINNAPNVSLIADLLERANADVIGLNEVYHPSPAPAGSALGWLAERLGMDYAFGACAVKRLPGTATLVSYGNALLSRAPLQSICSGLCSSLPGKEPRGYLEGRMDEGNGRTISVVVTHVDHTDETIRLAQLNDLFASARPGGDPWDVIMGDLNCIHRKEYESRPDTFARLTTHPVAGHLTNQPEGPRVADWLEMKGYTDAAIHMGALGGGTFIPAEEPVRLDYIWVSSRSLPRLASVEILEEPNGREASDHRAVVAQFSPLS